ncbi:MAG: hypothetical protein ACOX2Q_08835 [Dehalobacterium sp.]|jgi:hypothetical protein
MKKISDRFILGVICGLGGNLSKRMVENCFKKIGFTSYSGKNTAAGIFLKKSQISTPYGKVIGEIADQMIAAGLGVSCVYWFSLMGKDHYLIKGGGLGAAEWASLYGVTSRLGATSIFPVPPKDALATFLSHVAYGTTKAFLAVKLGDERLFDPNAPFPNSLRGNDRLCPPVASSIAHQRNQTAHDPGKRQT